MNIHCGSGGGGGGNSNKVEVRLVMIIINNSLYLDDIRPFKCSLQTVLMC